MVSTTQFRAYIAEQITENKIGLNDTNGNPASGGLGGPSFEIRNTIISDQRAGFQSAGFSNYLDAGKSRLIALTGMVSLNKFAEQRLENLTVSVWGSVNAQNGYAVDQARGRLRVKRQRQMMLNKSCSRKHEATICITICWDKIKRW